MALVAEMMLVMVTMIEEEMAYLRIKQRKCRLERRLGMKKTRSIW